MMRQIVRPSPVKPPAAVSPSSESNTTSDLPCFEMVPTNVLRHNPRNARTHSRKQITQVSNSIKRFGFMNPCVVDETGMIVSGHARLEASKLLGLKEIPVVRASHLNETELRAYMLADNKLAENSGWDKELLAVELGELALALPTLGDDLEITGFSAGETDTILLDFANSQNCRADKLPDFEETAVAQHGDLFLLGRHRLFVGDAREEQSYANLMQSEPAQMAFLDPPYNVNIQGHVGGRGMTKHREFKHASGEMTSKQFIQFLTDALGHCAKHTADGGISYICIDWRHFVELHEAGSGVYDELKNVCVWNKTTPGQGSFYRSQHELICVYKKGYAPHINTFELGQYGRSRSNVWTYPGANTFRAGRMDDLKMHPTVKPVALVVDAMKDCSRRDSIILDAFAGSGTTIAAAEQIGRRAFCMEIDPLYVDVAIRRWQRMTGKDATLAPDGIIFDELCITRATSAVSTKPHNKKVTR